MYITASKIDVTSAVNTDECTITTDNNSSTSEGGPGGEYATDLKLLVVNGESIKEYSGKDSNIYTDGSVKFLNVEMLDGANIIKLICTDNDSIINSGSTIKIIVADSVTI